MMKAIKIIRIIARLNIGGPAIHTVLLSEGLNRERFKSVLVCGTLSQDEGDMSYYAERKGVRPCRIPELTREIDPWKDLLAFIKIFMVLLREHPRILHTHTAKAGTLGRLAGLVYNALYFTGCRRIIFFHTFHGHVFEGYFKRYQTFLFLCIERFLACFTTAIVTVSVSVRDELVRLSIAPSKKIEVIPLGFELDPFLALSRSSGETVRVGIVGRLVSVKNHRMFLKSAAEIFRRKPDIKIRFSIVGDGELRCELEDFVRTMHLERRIDFLGWRKDLTEVYSALDIVVLTSLNEGTPVSLIEAMASGRPVAATDVGGVCDLLGRNDCQENIPGSFRVMERGILVASGDVSEMSEAIIFLAENKDCRERMGFRARDFARKNFGKERLVKDIERLYERFCPVVSVS